MLLGTGMEGQGRGGEGGRFHVYKSAIEDQTKAHLKTSSKKQ